MFFHIFQICMLITYKYHRIFSALMQFKEENCVLSFFTMKNSLECRLSRSSEAYKHNHYHFYHYYFHLFLVINNSDIIRSCISFKGHHLTDCGCLILSLVFLNCFFFYSDIGQPWRNLHTSVIFKISRAVTAIACFT